MKTMLVFLFVGVLTLPVSGFQKDIASNESKGARLKGKILDSRDKEMGIAGSNITIVGTELGGASMPDGFYMITNVPPGSWNVRVQHLSYGAQEKTISAKGDEEIVLDFELKRKDQKEVFSAQKMEQDPKDTAIYFVAVENLPEPIGGIETIQRNVAYPEIVRRAGIEGTAYVEAFINEDGRVARTAIARSAGHAALDSSAANAVAQARFKPGTQRGRPVKVRLAIPIRFRLSKDSSADSRSVDQTIVFVVEGVSGSGELVSVRVKAAYVFNDRKREMQVVVQKTPFEISTNALGAYGIFRVEDDVDRIKVSAWVTTNGVKRNLGSMSGRVAVIGVTPPTKSLKETPPDSFISF